MVEFHGLSIHSSIVNLALNAKHSPGICRGSGRNLLYGQAPELRQKVRRQARVGGFVALSTMRRRRQERAIGFQNNVIRRERPGRVAKVLRILERHLAGKTDQEAQFAPAFGLGRAVRKAVRKTLPAGNPHPFDNAFDDRESIAAMNANRLVQLACFSPVAAGSLIFNF